MSRARPAFFLPLVLLTAAACGGTSAPGTGAATAAPPPSVTAVAGADGVQQVTIDTTDMFRFAPRAIRARVGRLRIVLTDSGNYPHDISFPALHTTSATVSGEPGQRKTTLTVTFDGPGTYEFVCTFHSSAGMKGVVTVS